MSLRHQTIMGLAAAIAVFVGCTDLGEEIEELKTPANSPTGMAIFKTVAPQTHLSAPLPTVRS